MSLVCKQSAAISLDIWMADSADGKTGKTGLTLAVTLAKNGDTSFSSISPTVTEISSGHYKVDLTTTHDNTLGPEHLRATATGADPADCPNIVNVVAYDPADAVHLGLSAIPNVASGSSGAIPTTGTGANQIAVDGAGNVKADVNKWLAGAIPAVNVTGVPKVDVVDWLGTTVATPTVAGIPKAEASGGSIASVSGAVGSVTGAVGSVTGAVGSVTGAVGSVASGGITAASLASAALTAAKFGNDVDIQVIRTATAQGAGTGSNQIQLDASASSSDAFYNRTKVLIVSGAGAGQARFIIAYTGSTKTATVNRNWTTAPDNTSVFQVIPESFPVLTEGLAQAGGSTSITLMSTASAVDEFYDGLWIELVSGTGAGQCRLITAYNGTTKVATVARAWATNPDSTSGYQAHLGARVDVAQWLGGTIPTPNVTGVPIVDTKYESGTVQPSPTVAGIPKVEDATLQARLTSARGGYLDNLNVGGNVASSSEVTSIQNNTRCVRVVPDTFAIPTTGTRTYRIELLLYDDVGNMEAPDSAPTLTLVNQAGTDRSSRLDSTTMASVSTGRYRCVYTSTAGDTEEELVWAFSVVEGGATRIYGNASNVGGTASASGGGSGGGSGGSAIWTPNEPTATKRRLDLTLTNDAGDPAPRETDFIALGIVYVQGVHSPNADVASGSMTNVRRPFNFEPFTFTADSTTNAISKTSHGLEIGDGPLYVANSGGALPGGLAASTPYYAIYVDANHIKLATSLANAYAGTAIDLTTNGTGTQTMSADVTATKRGLDGYFVYEATQDETDHAAAQTAVIVEGSGYSRTNGGGGFAAAAMDPSDSGWDAILEGSVTREQGLRAVVRGELAKKTKSGSTITTRDLADSKDSHHGDVTPSGGRISSTVDDLT